MDPLPGLFSDFSTSAASQRSIGLQNRLDNEVEGISFWQERATIDGSAFDLRSGEKLKGLVGALTNHRSKEIQFENCNFEVVSFNEWNVFIQDLDNLNGISQIGFASSTLDRFRLENLAGVRSLQRLSFKGVSENKFKELCAGLVKFKGSALNSLTIADSGLTDAELSLLCDALKDGPSLVRLNLEGNKLEMKNNVARLLKEQTELCELILKTNPLNPSKIILQTLSISSKLKTIDLSDTRLTNSCFEDFLDQFFEKLEQIENARSGHPCLEVRLLGADLETQQLLTETANTVSETCPDLFSLYFTCNEEVMDDFFEIVGIEVKQNPEKSDLSEKVKFYESLTYAIEMGPNFFVNWLTRSFNIEKSMLSGIQALTQVIQLASSSLPSDYERICGEFTKRMLSSEFLAGSRETIEIRTLQAFADSLKSLGLQTEIHVLDIARLPRLEDNRNDLEAHPECIFGRDSSNSNVPRLYLLRESDPAAPSNTAYALLRPLEKNCGFLPNFFVKPTEVQAAVTFIPMKNEDLYLIGASNPEIPHEKILEAFQARSKDSRIPENYFQQFLKRFFVVRDSTGVEGDCLFDAFLQAFGRIPRAANLFQSIGDFRNQVVDHLEENQARFMVGIEQDVFPELTLEEELLYPLDEDKLHARYLKYVQEMRIHAMGGYAEVNVAVSLLASKGIEVRVHIFDRNYIPSGIINGLPVTNENLIFGAGGHDIYLYRSNEEFHEGALGVLHYALLVPRAQAADAIQSDSDSTPSTSKKRLISELGDFEESSSKK